MFCFLGSALLLLLLYWVFVSFLRKKHLKLVDSDGKKIWKDLEEWMN